MKELNPIFTREEFDQFLANIHLPKEVDKDFLYSVYQDADGYIKQLKQILYIFYYWKSTN